LKKRPWLLAFITLTFLLLDGCTTAPVLGPGVDQQTAYSNRAENIASVSEWNLVGRISLDDGEEGGSGSLQWGVKADHSIIDFHAAMGRGAWQLEIEPAGAALRLADGSEYFAEGVDTLLRQQIGWPIPVEALQWWVRGLAAPGAIDAQQLDAGGLLTSLAQFGWQIDFNRYASASGVALPTRLEARQNDYRVKLAIRRWHLPANDVAAN